MARQPTLVLVTGLPGTGKSSVAAVAADVLGASVLAHDWVMSGLRPYPLVQAALDETEWGHRRAGWSILTALARAQLVEGRSVVLDGVARIEQRRQCADLTDEVGAALVVITTRCSDLAVHRSRLDGRTRGIPGWYELTWSDVERSASEWAEIDGDLDLDAARPWEVNERAVRALLTAR